MDFCEKCFNMLYIREEKINEERTLVNYCINDDCDFVSERTNTVIATKKYKNTKIHFNNFNTLKLNDNTLPKKIVKCIHCKQTNNNPYEVHHIDNMYNQNVICISCEKNFLLKK